MGIDLLQLNQQYAFTAIDQNTGILVSEKESTIVRSSSAVVLLKKLAHQPTSKENLLFINDQVEFDNQALLTLQQLEEAGYVVPYENLQNQDLLLWEMLGYNTQDINKTLSIKRVSFKTLGTVTDKVLKSKCISAGIQLSEEAELLIVITDDYLDPELKNINKSCIDNHQNWLLIKFNGLQPLVGPLFTHKGSSACWECLASRLKLHDQASRVYQGLTHSDKQPQKPLVISSFIQEAMANLVVFDIIQFLVDNKHDHLEENLFSFDIKLQEKKWHHVVKRPQCTVCGEEKNLQFPSPIRLSRSTKQSNKLGGYRAVSPDVTLAKYKQHISEITGVVPYLKPFRKSTNQLVFNYSSGRNVALQSTTSLWLNQHLRSANGGKGKTPLQAKVGALCEAIERFSMMYHEKEYEVVSTFQDLEGAIDPNSCMLFSHQQFENRDKINAESTKFYAMIPQQLDRTKEIPWVPIYNLTLDKFQCIPAEFCFAQYPVEDDDKRISYPDSNGCAAGNTLDEAILQGLLELIERDAAAIWWYNRICRPAVDLLKLNHDYILQVKGLYHKNGRTLEVIDITTDIGIPVFVAVSADINTSNRIIYAFGSHTDVTIAIERAVVELNQLYPIVENKEASIETGDPLFNDWLLNSTLESVPYLKGDEYSAVDIIKKYEGRCAPTITDSLQYIKQNIEKQGMEILVRELTQPDIGLPVVKVVVPGLRHFWRRTAPGRLYHVPVQLGWRSTPLEESELNPISIFI